jgi:Zn-dependent protease
LIDILIALVAGVLAITLHEAAHGYAALAMGDDTAKRAGRLSLNPLVHVDKVGTILLPLGLAVGQLLTMGRIAFMFGWAKPVPVAAWKFANPRRAMMVVAAAGPAMNFVLAFLASVALLAVYPDAELDDARVAIAFLIAFIEFNLVLGLFNLLPLPPLDGGRIVVGLLPEGLARRWAAVERYGIVIVLLLVVVLPEMSKDFGMRVDPVGWLLNKALPWVMMTELHWASAVVTFFGGGGDG